MPLLLGQLVYTSFAGLGFKLLASAQTPAKIQQAFQQVAFKYWDSYNPPGSDYRAVYLHQVTPEHTLFGWLYNDGADDMGRSHVPYLICYYFAEPLLDLQLDNIFTCLSKGPVALMDRQSLPASLETILVPDLWSYQPARPGVRIPLNVRQRSHIALKHEELLDLFVSVDKPEIVTELKEPTYEQQSAGSIYTQYLVKGIEMDAATQRRNAASIEAEVIQSYREYQEKLQQYEQALIEAIQHGHPIDKHTDNGLKRLQQVLELGDEDIETIEARIFRQAVLAYRTSQLLLGASIAITVLALVGSTYGLIQTTIFAPSKSDIPAGQRRPTDMTW